MANAVMTVQTVGEALGRVVGAALAPVAAVMAKARGGRALHPRGTVCAAEVVAAAEDPVLVVLAHRLAGGAVVRMSGSLWRRADLPEMLGCAMRLRGPRTLTPEVDPQDQDILFATARAPWAVPLAMLTTAHHDYLQNVYYTIGRMEDAELGRLELRLVPLPIVAPAGAQRGARLRSAMEAGHARLRLELRRLGGMRGSWQPLCEVRLRGPLNMDTRALKFSPYQNGQGLVPRGFLHAMRESIYAAAQAPRAAE